MFWERWCSPIEWAIGWALPKYLDEGCYLTSEAEAKTVCGEFYLDFLVTLGEHRVAFECDGREFHRDKDRDHWRDTMILGSGTAQHIYRFRGADIHHHPADCLFVASVWTPEVFSERGRALLRRLATVDARKAVDDCPKGEDVVGFSYREPPTHRTPEKFTGSTVVQRHHLGDASWLRRFKYAVEAGGGNLDAIRARWDAADINPYAAKK